MADGPHTTTQQPQQQPSNDGSPAAPAPGGSERRQNPRLRELVDEMLASVRVAVRRDLWTEEERRQCEQELADVMQQVRFEAVWKGNPGARGKAAP